MAHKLLLADDSVTIQKVIELTFADEDVEVIAVSNGQQAIDRIASDPPDIVLADVGMPGQDGYEVASFIKDRPELSHIPVLLLTGAFEPVDEGRASAARCDGVLAKPFEPQLLISRVKELLPSRVRAAAPAIEPMLTGYRMGEGQAAGSDGDPAGEAGLDVQALLDAAPARCPEADASLDDYFDRLDRAFADLAGTRQAPAPPTVPQAAPVTPITADAAPALPPVTTAVPVADVFASLLQSEAAGAAAEAPRVPAVFLAQPPVPRELVEAVVREVVERMAAGEMRKAIADVVSATAERLVREEIERLKAAGR